MIITCPHCQTKYRVTYDAIGSAGRKVQCAHCHQAWNQQPVTPAVLDPVLDELSEDALDEALETAARDAAVNQAVQAALDSARAGSEVPGTADPSTLRQQQRAFSRRQDAMAARLPLARFRRVARLVALAVLVAALATLYWGRVEVVRRLPDLAGVYEQLGLPINVVGLDFEGLEALRTLSDGKEVLIVSAQLIGMLPDPVEVPPVVVTLLDSRGASLYEWSLPPTARDLMAGERASFETRLNTPSPDAQRVRLSFAGHSGATLINPAATSPVSGGAQISTDAEAAKAGPPASVSYSDPEHH